jgi:hypothetical protein
MHCQISYQNMRFKPILYTDSLFIVGGGWHFDLCSEVFVPKVSQFLAYQVQLNTVL